MTKSINNILVTGGAGYIGSHVCHLLIDQGYNVTCIDSLITGNKELLPKEVKLEIFDISEREKVTNLIKSNNFDLVMHFAGLIRVDESVEQPERYRDFNFIKAKAFLETCFENNLKKIIFSSTAAVYGNPKNEKVTEKDPVEPLNPYASSKLELENFIRETSSKYNSKYVILRYFNPIGAHHSSLIGEDPRNIPQNLVPIITEFAIGKSEKLTVYGDDYPTKDGTCIRDYIHIMDLADAHISALEYLFSNNTNNCYDVFNVGTGKGKTVKEVIDSFNKVSGKKIEYEISSRRKGDVISAFADTSKAKKVLNWTSKMSFEDAILSAWKWEQNK